uniref:Candidate secreted effector n=1 Tax=Meloidogyne incognita TaxID=6306 RepID=A0A914N270_MELIC
MLSIVLGMKCWILCAVLDSPLWFPSLSGEGNLVPPYGESVEHQYAGENKYAY